MAINNIDKVLDELYDARVNIRLLYNSASITSLMVLEDKIRQIISNQFKKCDISIDISNYNISIELADNNLISEKKKSSIFAPVDQELRSFILSHTSDNQLINYVQSFDNNIVDFFSVGNSIKFIL